MPAPFLSLLISDCIQTGRDYHDGGPRYNTSYIQGVGLGSITDILASIRYNVYDRKHVAMKELLEALRVNFRGREPLLQRFLKKTPKFGNDNDYADSIMKQIFEIFFRAVEGRPNTKGGEYHINLLPTTVHVYFGSVVGATADGRLEEQPLSEGVSPVQGSDQHGPTAVIKSVGKIDHLRTGGTLLNQKFSPQILEGEKGIVKLAHLIRSYFRMNGHHVQFNVIRVETLRAAQKEPDKYRNLIVRVAGYSDYFCNLSKGLQEEIIARTEHQTL
jgi:formate C-acetyltransferase